MSKDIFQTLKDEVIQADLSGKVFSPELTIRRNISKDPDCVLVLGISCFYHDSAVCLAENGEIIFASEEERFSRRKHDSSFPQNALSACLAYHGISFSDIDLVVYYEDPILKLRRMLTHNNSDTTKLREKVSDHLQTGCSIKQLLRPFFKGPVEYAQHHYAHAASTYYPSPYAEAVILTMDAVGEYATASLFHGKNAEIRKVEDLMRYPHSLGMLYSAITSFLGFKVNNDEYKVMGLASYGKPIYLKKLHSLIQDLSPWSFKLRMEYFDFANMGRRLYNEKRFRDLFGIEPRLPEAPLLPEHQHIACSLQCFTENFLVNLANHVHERFLIPNLCLAGGVALNCVANEKIIRETPFENMFIQPAAGDSGGCLGAALLGSYQSLDVKRKPKASYSTFLGPVYPEKEIRELLEDEFIPFHQFDDEELWSWTAKKIFENNIVGWFQGRMEFGPRALGNRSILANPLNPKMQDILNEKVKHRETFRPFAPAVTTDSFKEYFDFPTQSPFMLFTASVINDKRAIIPAVTHVDGSARLQTVSKSDNPKFHGLLKAFEKISGVPILINTSFNIRGEPIVRTPKDAFNCFLTTQIDALVLGNCVVEKSSIF